MIDLIENRNYSRQPPIGASRYDSGKAPLKPRASQMIQVEIASNVMIGTKNPVITSANFSIGARFV